VKARPVTRYVSAAACPTSSWKVDSLPRALLGVPESGVASPQRRRSPRGPPKASVPAVSTGCGVTGCIAGRLADWWVEMEPWRGSEYAARSGAARIRERTSARREGGRRVGRERLELLWAHEAVVARQWARLGPILVGPDSPWVSGLYVAVRRRLGILQQSCLCAYAYAVVVPVDTAEPRQNGRPFPTLEERTRAATGRRRADVDSSMRHSTEDWSSACCSVTCTDGLSAKSGSLPRCSRDDSDSRETH
jgi:hypothetical protein